MYTELKLPAEVEKEATPKVTFSADSHFYTVLLTEMEKRVCRTQTASARSPRSVFV